MNKIVGLLVNEGGTLTQFTTNDHRNIWKSTHYGTNYYVDAIFPYGEGFAFRDEDEIHEIPMHAVCRIVSVQD